MDFIDLTFGGALFTGVTFRDCTFFRVDLSGTVFEDCDGSAARFHLLALDNDSKMMMHGLTGQNVGTVSHPAAGDVYAPNDVQEVLQRLGALGKQEEPSPSHSDEAELLQHVARAYRRTNLVYENDDRLHHVFGHRFWPKLKRLLLPNEVVSEEVRSASRPRGKALRLRVALDQLLAGQTTENASSGPVSGLWRALRQL